MTKSVRFSAEHQIHIGGSPLELLQDQNDFRALYWTANDYAANQQKNNHTIRRMTLRPGLPETNVHCYRGLEDQTEEGKVLRAERIRAASVYVRAYYNIQKNRGTHLDDDGQEALAKVCRKLSKEPTERALSLAREDATFAVKGKNTSSTNESSSSSKRQQNNAHGLRALFSVFRRHHRLNTLAGTRRTCA